MPRFGRLRPSALLMSGSAALVCALTACGTAAGSAPDLAAPDMAESLTATTMDEEARSSSRPESVQQPVETDTVKEVHLSSLLALSEDEMMETLLTSRELINPPEGHSSATGLSYFEEKVAVDGGFYRQAFGEDACASAMDAMNLRLVGEGALDGVVHEYRRTLEDGAPEMLFVWALSYPRTANVGQTWNELLEACGSSGLRSASELLSVHPLEHVPFSGVSMDFSSGDPAGHSLMQGHSVSAEFGENLVVMSAINMSEEDFTVLMDRQFEKFRQLQRDLSH